MTLSWLTDEACLFGLSSDGLSQDEQVIDSVLQCLTGQIQVTLTLNLLLFTNLMKLCLRGAPLRWSLLLLL